MIEQNSIKMALCVVMLAFLLMSKALVDVYQENEELRIELRIVKAQAQAYKKAFEECAGDKKVYFKGLPLEVNGNGPGI